MPIVDRPNKEALIKALDIFLDKMRPFFIEYLHFAPGATVQIAIERSLRGDQRIRFSRSLHFKSELESAIEVSFFATLTETYWDDVFSRQFGGDRKVIRKLKKITEARNRASHPPHLRDLDDEFTQGSLCHIAYLLRSIRALEEHTAVVRLRDGLGNPARHLSEEETVAERGLEERAQEAVAAVLAAEKRAHIAEANFAEFREQTQATEISRVIAKSRASAAEDAKRRAEDLVLRTESACQEAEKRALAAEAGQLKSENQVQSTIEILREMERRLKETEAVLRRVQKREAHSRTNSGTKSEVTRPIQNRRPPARNTPQYEDWLIGEILSGKVSRSMLCQYAGDNRIDGRLVHYVHAASSGMSQRAWENYVASRRETIARGRHTGTSPSRTQPSHSRHGLRHKHTW